MKNHSQNYLQVLPATLNLRIKGAPFLILGLAAICQPAWSQVVGPKEGEGTSKVVAKRDMAGNAGIHWVRIPGGRFTMGSKNGNERPAHGVAIKSFQMAKTLVTNKQYQACVDAGACTDAVDGGASYAGDDQPVVFVEWKQADAFSKWVGGRLPSEAEWEYAARSAGKDWEYPWGNEEATCSLAVIKGCGHNATAPVCSKPAGNTKQGLCDMAGNAWELVQDWYHESYNGAPTDGSAWENPAASERIVRGGSGSQDAGSARSSHRGTIDPRYPYGHFGFRPARSLPDPAAK